MLKRSGGVLVEVMVVCLLLGAYLATTPVVFKQRTWQDVYQEFDHYLLAIRQSRMLNNKKMNVLGGQTSMLIGHVRIKLPVNWQVKKTKVIQMRPGATNGGTIYFENIKTKARKKLVIQLGGGTYAWR